MCFFPLKSPFNFWFAFVFASKPVSISDRSEASTVFGPSNVEITGSNPARGMDVCLRFSVLC
jgi:hypothetical protein